MKKSDTQKTTNKTTDHKIDQPVQDHTAELKAVDAELLLKIDELKAAEEKAQFLSLIAKQISDAVITTGLDNKINYVNESFMDMYGYSEEEILGKSPDILNAEPNSEQIQNDIYKALSSGGSWTGELLNWRKDGSTFDCELTVFPLNDKHGNVFAYCGIQRDITERKQAEKEREHLNIELSQKNKELSQIIYVTSHDLRSPLVNISGFSKELGYSLKELMSLLETKDVSSNVKEKIAPIIKQDIPESLEFIQKSISKMDNLLHCLLNLSRLGSSELNIEDINMNEMMFDIMSNNEFILKQAGVNTEVSELPKCKGDRTQVNQLFSNLLDNAIKYLDPEQAGVIKVTGNIKGDQSVYCVEDNGVGIAPEYREKIFEIFHQLEPNRVKGEGLGLTIVQRIVDRIKGSVWVESELGKGSKFFVSIPS